MADLGRSLKPVKGLCRLAVVLLLGALPVLAAADRTRTHTETQSHFVGATPHLDCRLLSDISWYRNGVRLANGDPNFIFGPDMRWLRIPSITSVWNSTELMCKGVSSNGRPTKKQFLILVYDQLVVQQSTVVVIDGSAVIAWTYPQSHLEPPLNCSVTVSNETADLYTETTTHERHVVAEQAVVNCLACSKCFVNLTIVTHDYRGPPHRQELQYPSSDEIAVVQISDTVSAGEMLVFQATPAVCGVLLPRIDDMNGIGHSSATIDAFELRADNLSSSTITVWVGGLTDGQYSIGFDVLRNGVHSFNQLPIRIVSGGTPSNASSTSTTNSSDSDPGYGVIVGGVLVAVAIVVVVVLVVMLLVVKRWRTTDEYRTPENPDLSTANLQPDGANTSIDTMNTKEADSSSNVTAEADSRAYSTLEPEDDYSAALKVEDTPKFDSSTPEHKTIEFTPETNSKTDSGTDSPKFTDSSNPETDFSIEDDDRPNKQQEITNTKTDTSMDADELPEHADNLEIANKGVCEEMGDSTSATNVEDSISPTSSLRYRSAARQTRQDRGGGETETKNDFSCEELSQSLKKF